MEYGNELVKYIPSIERYGNCFYNRDKLPDSRVGDFLQSKKFYLAFENSLHCKGYITEKFYRSSFLHNTVPVVWGTRKEDYLRIAPPHSFIHTEDFSSPKELSEYLLYLDSNVTAYREYFRWREDPNKSWDDVRKEADLEHPKVKTHPGNLMGMDLVCDKLAKDETSKIIHSLRKVVFDEESKECMMFA